MAASRKLQGEIDRCLKKVTEGVETFEDIWQKVHNATNSNQKEKYEADLKKEIKKLQRLRDQIKSWIASGEIKDKSTLLDYRKLIETQMERFKVVERETKTKAYSKEGLGAAQKLDPAQKEREQVSAWLNTTIDTLNLQLNLFESEIESLLVGKKKRLDKDKQDRMEDLKVKLEKHRFHIKKLETLLRMLDNMSVEASKINSIKDDVEYYRDSSQDPEFEDNCYIYDELIGLDDIELSVLPSSATTDSNSNGSGGVSPNSITSGISPFLTYSGTSPGTSPVLNMHNHSTESIECNDKKKKSESENSKPVKPLAVRAVNNSVSSTSNNSSILNSSSTSINSINSSALSVQTSMVIAGLAGGGVNPDSRTGMVTPNMSSKMALASSTPSKNLQTNSIHHNAHSYNNTDVVENGPVTQLNHTQALPAHHQPGSSSATPPPTLGGAGIIPASPAPSAPAANVPTHMHPPHNHPAMTNTHHHLVNGPTSHHTLRPETPIGNPGPENSGATGTTGNAVGPSASSLKSMAQEVVDRAGLEAQQPHQLRPQGVDAALPKPPSLLVGMPGVLSAVTGAVSSSIPSSAPPPLAVPQHTTELHIPPILGVAPLGQVPLTKEQQVHFQMIEALMYRAPTRADAERFRPYLSRNPLLAPHPLYHQMPLAHSDTVEFFQRLSTESLFFIFYYMEGSKAQYLAAKALKKQSWRFHTKYMMWFQRHEEPKIINEEYEQGTYIYFDYEKWGQRKKEGFTFEYKYLEDRDLN